MDSLTHGLLAATIFSAAGIPALAPFAVLGCILPDLDLFLKFVSDRSAGSYIFTHGGLVHSLAGAFVLSLGTGAVLGGISLAGLLPPVFPVASPYGAWLAILSGSLLHVLLDFLATPGIPLFFPLSDRKFTLGIFAGPSLFMLGLSVFTLVLLVSGAIPPAVLPVYGLAFLGVLAVRAVLLVSVSARVEGRALPTVNPFRWLIVGTGPDSIRVGRFHIIGGMAGSESFPLLDGVTGAEMDRLRDLPEVRRLRYNSYAVTARREGGTIILSDPLRTKGYLFYPPDHREVRIPAGPGQDRPGHG